MESSLFPKKVIHILFLSVWFPAESLPQALQVYHIVV